MPTPSRADLVASTGTAVLLLAVVAIPFGAFTWLLGVNFAFPSGAWLGAAVVPLLLLYMLKVRRPRRTVATLLFWRPISLEQRSQSPFKRLRRNLVLLMQLLALAALSYGIARPVIQADVRDGASLVLVMDTSASMLARDVEGATRFEAGRRQALQLVRALGAQDQASVIAVDRAAWTVVPWTRDVTALEQGLRRLSPRHARTDLGDALALAGSALHAAGGRGEVHVFSDGGGPPPSAATLTASVRYHRLGTTANNLGLVAVDARPRVARASATARVAGDDGVAYEVFARVVNAGEATAEVFVGLEREGTLLAARRLSAPAGGSVPVVLEARLLPGPVRVRLLPPTEGGTLDVLDADDEAHVLIPEEKGVLVALVSDQPSPALERVLEAAGATVLKATPEAFQDDPRVRLVVFEGVLPRGGLPPRDCLIVDPPGPVGPVSLGERVPRLTPAGWDRDHPLLAFVDPAGVEVLDAPRLVLGGGARVLMAGEAEAGAEAAVLLAAWTDGSAKRTLVGFDLYRSTWPLRASFPIFIQNCLLVATEGDRRARGGVQAGVPVSIPVGADVTVVEVEGPEGTRETISAWGGTAYFAGTALGGVYRARSGDRVEAFCVNLTDEAETRIAPRERLFADERQLDVALATQRPREVGQWFAMLALVLFVTEFWVYHRRLD